MKPLVKSLAISILIPGWLALSLAAGQEVQEAHGPIEVTKQAPESIGIFQPFDLIYTLKNVGEEEARNLVLQDELPEGLGTTDGQRVIKFEVDQLKPGESREFRARVMSFQTGNYSSSAIIVVEGEQRYTSNDPTTKVVAPELVIELIGPEKYIAGSPITYQALVRNEGEDKAEDARLSVTVDEQAILQRFSKSAPGKSLPQLWGNRIHWDLGTMDPGEERKTSFTIRSDLLELEQSAEVSLTLGGPPVALMHQPGAIANLKTTKIQPQKPASVVQVLYGTNRSPTSDQPKPGHLAGFYGAERGDLKFGVCHISIPAIREIGTINRPWLLEKEKPAEHFTLIQIRPSRDEFTKQSKAVVQSLKDRGSEREGLVFIHGYNTSFADAAYRTAQIAHDLDFAGPALMFSWPSRSSISSYFEDEDLVELSIAPLQEFLRVVSEELDLDQVHLIAHSMGSRLLTKALTRMARQGIGRRPMFHQIILAAPDIDAEVFKEEIVPFFNDAARRVTLYASENDQALRFSRWFRRGRRRLGEDLTQIPVLGWLDSIDASDIDTGLLGHAYAADRPSVLADIRAVLKGAEPGVRGLFKRQNYWYFPSQNSRRPWLLLVGVAFIGLVVGVGISPIAQRCYRSRFPKPRRKGVRHKAREKP